MSDAVEETLEVDTPEVPVRLDELVNTYLRICVFRLG